jgi:glucose-6-phosphate-specific signal transduction histidine kinase
LASRISYQRSSGFAPNYFRDSSLQTATTSINKYISSILFPTYLRDGDIVNASLTPTSIVFAVMLSVLGGWTSLILIEEVLLLRSQIEIRSTKQRVHLYHAWIGLASVSMAMCTIWSSYWLNCNLNLVGIQGTTLWMDVRPQLMVHPVFEAMLVSITPLLLKNSFMYVLNALVSSMSIGIIWRIYINTSRCRLR